MDATDEPDEARQRFSRRIGGDRSSEYNSQPDSSGTIGGHRGEQEYGLRGDLVEEAEHNPRRNPGAAASSAEIILEEEPIPYGEVDDGFPGISEWSKEHSLTDAKPEDGGSRPDDEIREELQQQLEQRLGDRAQAVQISVNQGSVSLTGQVKSHATAEDLRQASEAVPGVRAVDNQLRILHGSSV